MKERERWKKLVPVGLHCLLAVCALLVSQLSMSNVKVLKTIPKLNGIGKREYIENKFLKSPIRKYIIYDIKLQNK